MSDVDKLQNAEEQVAQMQDAERRAQKEAAEAELREPPVVGTAEKPRHYEEIPWGQIKTAVNLRLPGTGELPDIQELALSIKNYGLLQPILVRPLEAVEGTLYYELVEGNRRLAAFARLHADDTQAAIPAIVVEGVSEAERYAMMFAAMAGFRDWDPISKARALRYLLDLNPEQTAKKLASSLGLRADYVQRHLRLLDLPEELAARLEKGDLSFTVADLLRRGISAGRLTEEAAGDLAASYSTGEISAEELRDLAAPPRPQPDPLAEADDSDAPWGAKVWDPEFAEKMEELEAAAEAKAQEAREREELEAEADRILSFGGKPDAAGEEVTPYEPDADSGISGPNKRRLYSYLLGRLLRDVAPKGYLDELGVTVGEVYDYAWRLDNQKRMSALVDLAQALAEDDMALPTEIFPDGV